MSSSKAEPQIEVSLSDILSKLKWAAAICVFLFVILPALFNFVFIVSPGQSGVVVNMFSGANPNAYGPGTYLLVPFVEHGLIYDVTIQREDELAAAATKDLQDVSVNIAVNFHPAPALVPMLHQKIGPDYHLSIIEPAIQESIKATTAQFTAEELVTRREEVKVKIRLELEDRLKDRYVVIDDINIVNLEFSDSFNNAINAKVTVQQEALTAENTLRKIQAEAAQKIASAEGEANSTILRAEASAYSTRVQGEAEASAIRAKSDALKESPALVEYTIAQRWDGKVPLITSDSTKYLNVKDFIPAEVLASK